VTIQSQILDDLDSVFAAGLTIDAVHVNGSTNETLKVFFDRNYARALGNGEVESESPTILVKTEDTAHIDRASVFTILGAAYYVAEMESDFEGTTRIRLTEDQN
jgi:hypothetical protein